MDVDDYCDRYDMLRDSGTLSWGEKLEMFWILVNVKKNFGIVRFHQWYRRTPDGGLITSLEAYNSRAFLGYVPTIRKVSDFGFLLTVRHLLVSFIAAII